MRHPSPSWSAPLALFGPGRPQETGWPGRFVHRFWPLFLSASASLARSAEAWAIQRANHHCKASLAQSLSFMEFSRV